jgi:drug efflux transport system ATP-binding protein
MSVPIISTRGLTRRFGDFVAVDDLSIAVEPGSIFAFLGANGSGKSTTIRMLIGLLRPTAGEITVDGIDVIRHPRRVRDRIGYMGQRVSLYQGLTLRENVEFYAGLFGLAGAELERRWSALCDRFALRAAAADRPENLPAGVRQRAGLALATLHQPKLLFLDEPTAGVDIASRQLFWEFIQEEAAGGRTIFVTTHFLEEVEYCDWASFIDAGRLIADATPEALRRTAAGGYTIHLDGEPSCLARGRQALARLAPAPADVSTFAVRELDPDVRRLLRDLHAREPGLVIRIGQPSMNDVFRRVLAEKRTAA